LPTAADPPQFGWRERSTRLVPLKISRRLALEALYQGIDAADAGEPITACPYAPNGTLIEQFAMHWWVKGWRRRRVVLEDMEPL
jgi:hypothetical protein